MARQLKATSITRYYHIINIGSIRQQYILMKAWKILAEALKTSPKWSPKKTDGTPAEYRIPLQLGYNDLYLKCDHTELPPLASSHIPVTVHGPGPRAQSPTWECPC